MLIHWKKIEYVFLDMDGTLLDLHFDNYFWLDYVPRCYAQARGLTAAEARAYLYRRYKALEGTLEWYCVEFWSRELELDIAGLKRQISHKITVHPEVVPFLEAVRDSGRRLALVTNAHGMSVDLKLDKTGLRRYFHRVISSHELGFPKEDPRFWVRLSRFEAHEPRQTLFVDDNLDVLRVAVRSGIGQVLAVRNPDSRQIHKDTGEFDAISSFDELLPVG